MRNKCFSLNKVSWLLAILNILLLCAFNRVFHCNVFHGLFLLTELILRKSSVIYFLLSTVSYRPGLRAVIRVYKYV